MKKIIKLILLVSLVVIAQTYFGHQVAKATWTYDDVEPTKSWVITFSKPIDEDSISKDTIYVTNGKGQKIDVEILLQTPSMVVVEAPKTGYENGQVYKLVVENTLESTDGQRLNASEEMIFTIKKTSI